MLHALPLLIGALTQPTDAALSAFVDEGKGNPQEIATALRDSLGPQAAVDAIFGRFPKDRVALVTTSKEARLERLRTLLDATAAQKDAWAAGFGWHTDLEKAKKEAQEKHKPILSLRLLGRLDEDLSCANSRFFRTLLYPDPVVQEQMKGFVLHWQTVRPAPKLTIDMGDGRVMTTTITGNSAHLVLDDQGRVVDALPGMVSPQAFAQMLASASAMSMNMAIERPGAHERFRQSEARLWSRLAGDVPLPLVGKSARAPLAMDAGPMAMTKAMPEMPVVRAIAPVDVKELRTNTIFDQLAETTKKQVTFSDAAKVLIVRKLAPGQKLDVVLNRLQLAVAKDTVINRFVLHDAVRSWLADGTNDARVVQDRLYDELFLTPKADPWLGLVDEGAYFGVDGGGLR